MKEKQSYSPEFRAEAVKLVLEQGLSREKAAKRLAVPKGTLANWVVTAKLSRVPAAPGSRSVSELEAEVVRLRKELAEARMERDVLKKRPRTLPRSHCQVRADEGVASRISGGSAVSGANGFPQRLL